MLLNNNTTNRITGVVQEPESNAEYKGVTTSTAKVTINDNKEVRVDVLPEGFLGSSSGTAYPGNKGEANHQSIQKAIEDLNVEIARAKSAETDISNKVDTFTSKIEDGDAVLQTMIQNESARAVAAETILNNKIAAIANGTSDVSEELTKVTDELRTEVTDTEKRILKEVESDLEKHVVESNAKFAELTTKINTNDASLRSDLRKLNDDLYDDFGALSSTLTSTVERIEAEQIRISQTSATREEVTNIVNDLRTDLDSVLVGEFNDIDEILKKYESDVRQVRDDIFDEWHTFQDETSETVNTTKQDVEEAKTRLTNIETNYATKIYVHEEVANAVNLSKQLVTAVDLLNNVVLIDGKTVDPVSGVLYLAKDVLASGSDVYKEYTAINGILTLIGDTSIDLEDYATKEFVERKVANVEVDLSDYAKKSEIPDVSSFIAEIPEEYVTDYELEDLGYVTSEAVTNLLNSIKFIDGGTSASV